MALRWGLSWKAQEDGAEEDDDLEPVLEERDAETFDDSEFYQQLLKEFLDGSAIGSGAGALAASAGVSTHSRPLISPTPLQGWLGQRIWFAVGLC